MVNISVQKTVVWSPRLKLCHLLQPHLYVPEPVCLLVLDPILVADQASFTIWFELVVPFTVVRELDHEWFVVCIAHYHCASSCL